MLRKGIISSVLFIMLILLMTVTVGAEEAKYSGAEMISNGFNNPELINDDSKATYSESYQAPSITVKRSDSISSLYIVFDKVPGQWTMTEKTSGVTVDCGVNGFLHEFVDVKSHFADVTVNELKLSFPKGCAITEIYAFSEGDIPTWVEIWQPPCEKADLLIVASHAGDENMYFAGVIPYYATVKNMNVQVIYLVNHNDSHDRPHEMLYGLWASGLKNYPVVSDFPDVNVESTDRTEAKNQTVAAYSAMGITVDSFVEYVTENIRRFKPLVLVSHDTNGENGHGIHVLGTDVIAAALDCSMNTSKYPESLDLYGGWTPDKVYFHMYENNVMNLPIDTLFQVLDSKSPFTVSQEAFKLHKTQLWTTEAVGFLGSDSNVITKSSQVEKYDPAAYGLYFTAVGNDVECTDFFEHIKSHSDREEQLKDPEITLPDVETIPDELVVATDTFDETEPQTVVDEEDKKRDNGPIIVAVVLVSVAICISIVIITVASSKTSVRSRRRKRQRN